MPDPPLPDPTLLDIIQKRFGVDVDPDSNGGKILNSLKPLPTFNNQSLIGQASLVSPLTLTLADSGISVYAAQGAESLVFSLPPGPLDFTIIPPDEANISPKVELKLLPFTMSLPFLHPAQALPNGMPQAVEGKVELNFPDLLLVVIASVDKPASAFLAPPHDATGTLEVTMVPPLAVIDPSNVVGLGFKRATLKLNGHVGPEIIAPVVEIYLAPPGIPALAMHGSGHDLRLGLGGDGLSGDFRLALSEGAQAVARPRFLNQMSAHLRLNRNAVTLLELTGKIDLDGEVRVRLGQLGELPEQIDYSLGLTFDNDWRAALTLRASEGRNFLWRTQRSVPNPDVQVLRDTLGAYAVFSPQLASNLPPADSSGYVNLTLAAGAASGLVTDSNWPIVTRSVTLYGGELVIHKNKIAGDSHKTYDAFLFFDLETEFDINMKVGNINLLETKRPLKVRHKAIGLRLDFGSNGDAPQLWPIFDPIQGFSLDLSDPGVFSVPESLGDILQTEGVRMTRENPLNFEVDLVPKADLGVVSIDRASVRIPLDSPVPPTLTALGAHVNVPGAIKGSGYLKLLPNGGFNGILDAAIIPPPFGVRVSAGLALKDARDKDTQEAVTAVLVTLGVELPVPIPLASSGLGLFGFCGLFAMHCQRKPAKTALGWFVDIAKGKVTCSDAWEAVARKWALGLGAVIGTIEGGFLINAKGMAVVELPGPHLLLVMNANILNKRPDTRGTETGKFLAIIEILPKKSLTIGIVVDYHDIQPLIEFRVPAEAFFDFKSPENWHLDVGGIPPKMPASVKFLAFRADGYLMIHGNGIDLPTEPTRRLEGFSVAAGVRAAFIWGSEDLGLYLKIATQTDVGISFKPFMIIGKIMLSGELHLFIVSIEASASAEMILIPDRNTFFISAEVCGRVDFFFFEVKGCVKLELGDPNPELPEPEPLVRALSLHSRISTPLFGSANDRPVDGSLGEAAHFDSRENRWIGDLPVVPIDSIPVLQMELRPHVDSECRFFNEAIDSKLPPNGWLRRGERFYRYILKSVNMTAENALGAPFSPSVGEGCTPAVWWDRYGKPGGGDDHDVQLALLSWDPDPTPAAAERTKCLDERIKRHWGNICAEAAEPARVLWTFRHALTGPSPTGWSLTGIPWPDQPGKRRSAPPYLTLRVTEPWRSGNILADSLAQVTPAFVYAYWRYNYNDLLDYDLGFSKRRECLLVAPRTGFELLPSISGDEHFKELFSEVQSGRSDGLADGLHLELADALRLDCAGNSKFRALLAVEHNIWEKGSLILRARDITGQKILFEQSINPTTSFRFPMWSHEEIRELPLPAEWVDQTGPWFTEVMGILHSWYDGIPVANDVIPLVPHAELVFIEVNLPKGASQLEIGLKDIFEDELTEDELTNEWFTNWGLLLVDGVTERECQRYSFDVTNRENQIKTVNRLLHANQANMALLHPDAVYTVDLTYYVMVTNADEKGNPLEGKAERFPKDPGETLKQKFRFKTDNKLPERLDPWVMTTDPSPSENFFFYGDPLRVVFATNATRKLFKAYGNRALVAVVKAASGKHPPSDQGSGSAGINLETSPLVNIVPIPAFALTPFESSLCEALASQDCIDFSLQTARHEQVQLKMKLEPLTDYILDLEVDPALSLEAEPTTPSYPMFRLHFSTSRYENVAALAADVANVQVKHRRITDAVPLAELAARTESLILQISDLEFEKVLRAMHWGDLTRAEKPRVTVIHQDRNAGSPSLPSSRPVAVLIETPEPIWRWRTVPQEVTDEHGTRRYQLKQQSRLKMVETTAGEQQVLRFFHSTSRDRTLAILKPSVTVSGGSLSLALRLIHHPLFEGSLPPEELIPLITLSMQAPWEERS